MLNSPLELRAYLGTRFIVPIACIASMLILIASVSGVIFWVFAAFLAIMGLTWFIGYKSFILNYFLKARLSRAKKESRLPYGQSQVTISFEGEHIYATEGSITSTIGYEGLEKVEVGDHALYIYLSAAKALVIPLRAFESPAQKQDLADFLRKKLEVKENSNV
jgi:hypothetical protein